MKLNKIKLSKEDAEAILKELNKDTNTYCQKYNDFLKECLKISKQYK